MTTPSLLDRPLGELTLRELTHLGQVARAVTDALEHLPTPTPAPAAPLPAIAAAAEDREGDDEPPLPALPAGRRGRPTVADGIRAVVAGQPLPGVAHVDAPPAAETMASAIAARTAPANGHTPRRPRTREEVDRAIEETRTQVAAQTEQRGPGKGKKFCTHCHQTTGVTAKNCRHCFEPFK